MKSYKEYKSNTQETASGNADVSMGKTAEELTKKIAAAYHGKSNADMFKEILTQAEEGKRKGTLSNAEIENFYQAFSPMLNSTQKRRLHAIVEELKNI